MFLCTYVYFFFKEKSYVYFHFSIKCPVIFPLSVYSFRAHGWAGLMVQPEGRIASARSDSAMGKGNTSPELETLHKATTGCGLFCICRFRRHETHAKWHILTSFCSQELRGFIFLSPEPWAGGPGMETGVGLELLILEISLLNFCPQHGVVGPAWPHLCPSN